MSMPLHDTQKMHPLQPAKLHFASLLPYLATFNLNDYTYLNILVYIETSIGFKQAHNYDYHSYAE